MAEEMKQEAEVKTEEAPKPDEPCKCGSGKLGKECCLAPKPAEAPAEAKPTEAAPAEAPAAEEKPAE